MRVLDLDLDFFLNEVPIWRSEQDGRCDSSYYKPWEIADVREFLTTKCGLTKDTPIPGNFVTQHHEAFAVWRDLIASNCLRTPFEVVHVDSHADLGCGDAGYQYLMSDILNRDLADRENPDIATDKMNFANYLAFAMACRWINAVTYVPNPNGEPDLFEYYFQNGDSRTEIVELKAVEPELFDDVFMALRQIPAMPCDEPPIRFSTVPLADFHDDGTFDHIILCHSPSFTPIESDELIPVIREFMLEPSVDESIG